MTRSQTARAGSESLERRRPAAGASGASATAVSYVRSGLNSGAIAGILGVLTLVRARRTLMAGSGDDATRQSLLAVFWIGVAMTQWGLNRSDRQAARGDAVSATGDVQWSTP